MIPIRVKNTLWIPVLVCLFGTYARAQISARAQTGAVIKPGEVVVLELNGKLGRDVQVDWKLESGKGEVEGRARHTGGAIRARCPGRIVVVCRIVRVGAAPREQRGEFLVAGEEKAETAAAQPVPATPARPPAPQPAPPSAVAPAPAAQPAVRGDIEADNFVPSGYQGDARAEANPPVLDVENGNTDRPHSPPACTKITYTPQKPGWVALSYLPGNADQAGVWGETKGQDYSHEGYQSFRVWARGVMREQSYPKVQFVSGGNTAPKAQYPASYQATGPTYRLNGEFQEFCIDVKAKDLSNVFSPLTVVLTSANNPKGAALYIDTMHYSSQGCG